MGVWLLWAIAFPMRQKLSGKLFEAGVDYITVTCAELLHIDRARRLALSLAEWELAANMLGRPFNANGYQGFKVGSLQYGERDDGSMLRLSGDLAAKFWQRAYDVADNVTRIDLQCTYKVTEAPAVVVGRHYKELCRKKAKLKRGPEVSRIQKKSGGYTVYSGVRQSDRWGRCYDKEAQSKLPRYLGCVRYEEQFGNERALKVATGIRRTSLSMNDIAVEVLRFFSERGAGVRSLQEQLDLAATAVDSSLCKRTSDITRKYQWLEKCVRPTLRMLAARGELELIEKALSLALVR